MKRILLISCLIFSALFIGLSSTQAWDNNYNGKIYFDNSNTQWTDSIKFMIGKSNEVNEVSNDNWYSLHNTQIELDQNGNSTNILSYDRGDNNWGGCQGFYFSETTWSETTGTGDWGFYYLNENLLQADNITQWHDTYIIQDNYSLGYNLCMTPIGTYTDEHVNCILTAVPLKDLALTNNSTIISGHGTEASPYIVKRSDGLSLTASADFIDDSNSATKEYAFTINDTEQATSTTATYTNSTLGNYTVTFKARNVVDLSTYSDLVDNLIGTMTVSNTSKFMACPTTLYYKVIDKPTISATAITDITNTGAVISLTEENNQSDITLWGYYYSTESFDSSDLSSTTRLEETDESFSKTLTGLDRNTTYYVMPYAINAAGTGYGELKSFTTTNILTVSNDDTSNPEAGTYDSASYTVTYSDITRFKYVSMPFYATAIKVVDSSPTPIVYTTTSDSTFLLFSYNTTERSVGATAGTEWTQLARIKMGSGKGYLIGFDDGLTAPVTVTFSKSSSTTVDYTTYRTVYGVIDLGEAKDANWYFLGTHMFSDATLSGPSVLALPKTDAVGYDYLMNDPLIDNTNIEPYTSFFVQYTGTILIDSAGPVAPPITAVTHDKSTDKEYFIFHLKNTSESETARAIICTDSSATTAYEVGRDFPNMNGASLCGLYTNTDNTDLFLNYLPNTTITTTLNATLTTSENYTISMEDRPTTAYHVWLTDKLLHQTTDLMVNDYTFSGTQGFITDRFEIQIARMPDTATGVEHTSSNLEVYGHDNTIEITGLDLNAQVFVYNAVGQLMAQPAVTSTSLSLEHLPQGIYLVKLESETMHRTFKLNLK